MVIPLYDHDPLKDRVLPVVTWGLIAVNVIVFFIQLSADGTGDNLLAAYGVIPAVITGNAPNVAPIPAYATVLTGMFMHAGWWHLIGNMIYLWVFGDDIEEAMGRLRFLVFYLLSGIGAALAYVGFNMASTVPMVGASGAIAGVLAAYLLLRPCARITVFMFFFVYRVQAMWVILLWAILQLGSLIGSDDDSIAYMAHIGGLAAGACLFVAMRPKGVELFECMDDDRQA